MSLDPLGTITTLASVISYLLDVAAKVQQNRAECIALGTHAQSLLVLLKKKCVEGLPEDLTEQLRPLISALRNIASTLDDLNLKPRLKRILWRDRIGDQISEAYAILAKAAQTFDLETTIDIRRLQDENEAARRQDAQSIHTQINEVISNDQAIISMLEIQKTQMQEAMIAMNTHLSHLGDTMERSFMERSIQALEHRTGKRRTLPDFFSITSLDVIIHEDDKLGAGGYGQVYVGDWHGTRVAVKVLEKGLSPSVLEKEIDVWRRLRHPHILQFHGACSVADPPFAVCALKANGDALAYLAKYPMADRHKLLHEASLGLVYLHKHSVVHGDLKASNILIDEHGVACLADFGLSQIKLSTTTLRSSSGLATAQATMGTARWAAPEQLMFGVISKASDVYSFGMTAFEVFTGKAPFAHTPDTLLLNLVVDRKLRPPRPSEDEAPSLDNATWTFVGACWVDEQSARPSATQIEAALKRLRSALVVPTPSSLPAVAPVEEPSPVLVDPNKPPDGHLLTPPGTPPLPLTYHPFVSPHRDSEMGLEATQNSPAEPSTGMNSAARSRSGASHWKAKGSHLLHRPSSPQSARDDEARKEILDLCDGREQDVLSKYQDLRLLRSYRSSRENIAYTARDASGNATVLRYIAIKSSRKSHIQAHISATKLPRHPSLVEHREAFVWKNAFWIAMEDVPWSLDDVLARTPSFLESHIAYVTAQVVSGLLVLHKLNMVHRDIKSFNIRIGFQGQVKIAHFESCAYIAHGSMLNIVGDPYWMAPEIIEQRTYDQKVDVWSLGITLIEMVDGRPRHAAEEPFKDMQLISSNGVGLREPSKSSPALTNFASRCLVVDPGSRAGSVELSEHPFLKTASTKGAFVHDLMNGAYPRHESFRDYAIPNPTMTVVDART